VSKPFQTEVKEGYRQATEWTAENIQKNPVGYLTWALEEVGKTEQKLQASVLSLKTKKNGAERALERNHADQTEYNKLLDEFKNAYRSASSPSSWPVTVRNASFEENALKRKIVECNDKLKNVGTLVETYTKTKNVIDRKLTELDGKLAEVIKLKNKLSTDLEIAKVNKSVEGIDSIGDQLNAIVDTTAALVSTSEEGTSVEEMIKPTGDQRVEDEFAKIMGK
jgi:chromosome segregation ATPase